MSAKSSGAVCRWVESVDGYWATDCEQAFAMIDGTPEDNAMHYCCYCGRPLVVNGEDEEERAS